MNDQTKTMVISGALIVIMGIGSFYGGMKYGQSKTPANAFVRNGANFQGGMMGGRGNGTGGGANGGVRMRNGGFIAGQIIKQDANSITLDMGNNAGSKTVYISGSTIFSKSVDGTKDDLVQGKTVMVSGTPNSDGSIVAQTIQIRPDGAPAFGGRGGDGGNSPTGGAQPGGQSGTQSGGNPPQPGTQPIQ